MASSELLRKIHADFPAGFILGEVRAETRHRSYARPLAIIPKKIYERKKCKSDNNIWI